VQGQTREIDRISSVGIAESATFGRITHAHVATGEIMKHNKPTGAINLINSRLRRELDFFPVTVDESIAWLILWRKSGREKVWILGRF
jgi:hypothetical protein